MCIPSVEFLYIFYYVRTHFVTVCGFNREQRNIFSNIFSENVVRECQCDRYFCFSEGDRYKK